MSESLCRCTFLLKSKNTGAKVTSSLPNQQIRFWKLTFFVPFVEYVIRSFITGIELFNGDALRHCLCLVLEIESFHTFSHYGKVQASLLCS